MDGTPHSLGTLELIADTLPDAMAVVGMDLAVRHFSPALIKLCGVGTAEARGRYCFDFVHPDDRARVIDAFWRKIGGEDIPPQEFRIVAAEGGWTRVEGSLSAVPGTDAFIAAFRSIARLETNDIYIRFEHQFLRSLIRDVQVGIIACDQEGRVVTFNAAMAARHDRPPAEQTMDQWIRSFVFFEADGCTPMSPEDSPIARALRGEPVRDAECVVLTRDRSLQHLRANGRALSDGAGGRVGSFVALQDITEQRRAEEALRRRATQDSLTGLLNRAALIDHLRAAIPGVREGRPLGVFFMDLDDFKAVNDRMGHGTGDQLLAEIGHRLSEAIGEDDVVARLGGDEFVVVCGDVRSIEDAEGIRSMIRDVTQAPVRLGPRTITPHISIGAAVCIDESETPEHLLRAADAAMYRDKRARGRRAA